MKGPCWGPTVGTLNGLRGEQKAKDIDIVGQALQYSLQGALQYTRALFEYGQVCERCVG